MDYFNEKFVFVRVLLVRKYIIHGVALIDYEGLIESLAHAELGKQDGIQFKKCHSV
jgi:hypothetical protein